MIFFPDIEKFVSSVMVVRRTSNYDELSQQKRFRLKKHLTAIRSGKSQAKQRKNLNIMMFKNSFSFFMFSSLYLSS